MRTDAERPRSAPTLMAPQHTPAKRRTRPLKYRHAVTVRAAAVCLMIIASGCAATHEPFRWSKSVVEMQENVYGSWIWITLQQARADEKAESFGGELIAVSKDSIYIASPTLRIIPVKAIRKARLSAYDPYSEGVAALSLLGSLTTISNGWFLGITWPMWILGGSIAALSRSYTPVLDYPGDTFDSMSAYARYPAGLPAQLERSKLIMVVDQRKLFAF